MESRTKVTKGMKGTLAAIILLVGVFASRTQATNLYVGGTVPLINQLVGFGNTGLDLTTTGANVKVAWFYISNNAPGGFDFTIILKNGGEFVPLANASPDGNGLDWSAATELAGTHGTLGTGITYAAPTITLVTPTGASTGGDWASGAQTAATVDYEVILEASWTGTTTLLAGVYVETVEATLTADM